MNAVPSRPPRAAVALFAAALLFTPVSGRPRADEYAPKEGRYAIKFPGRPTDRSQTVKTEIGDLKVTTALFATAEGNANWVSYTDYPPDAIKPAVSGSLIDAARDALKGPDGKVVSEKEITFGEKKLPGREVVLDRGKQQIRCRFLVREPRLYQLGVMGPGEFVTGKQATAFLDSFEVR